MLERLIDFVQQIFISLLPWAIVEPYQQAVLTRLGKFNRVLEPGFHWRLPFFDVVLADHVTPRTEHLVGLATTTKDGQSIGFDAVITYRISDIRKAVLDVTDLKDAIADTCAGVIGTALHAATWEAILSGDALEELTNLCRKRGWKWGVEIQAVQLAGVALVKNLRLSGIQPQAAHPTIISRRAGAE